MGKKGKKKKPAAGAKPATTDKEAKSASETPVDNENKAAEKPAERFVLGPRPK